MDQKIHLKTTKEIIQKKPAKIQITSLKCAGQAPFNQSSKEHLDIKQLIMLVHVEYRQHTYVLLFTPILLSYVLARRYALLADIA